MLEHDIIYLALQNLQKNTQIQGKLKIFNQKEVDGQLTLGIDNYLSLKICETTKFKYY